MRLYPAQDASEENTPIELAEILMMAVYQGH